MSNASKKRLNVDPEVVSDMCTSIGSSLVTCPKFTDVQLQRLFERTTPEISQLILSIQGGNRHDIENACLALPTVQEAIAQSELKNSTLLSNNTLMEEALNVLRSENEELKDASAELGRLKAIMLQKEALHAAAEETADKRSRESEARTEDLEAQINDMEKELEMVRRASVKATAELRGEIQEREENIEHLNGELAEIGGNKEELIGKIAELTRDVEQLSADSARWSRDIKTMEVELSVSKSDNQALRRELESRTALMRVADARATAHGDEMRAKEQIIQKLHADLTTTRDQLDVEQTRKPVDCHPLQQCDVSTQCEQKKDVDASVDSMHVELNRAELERLTAENERLSNDVEKNASQLTSLQQELDQEKATTVRLVSKLDAQKRISDVSSAQDDACQAEKTTLVSRINKVEAEIRQCVTARGGTDAELAQRVTRVEELEKLNMAFMEKLRECTQELVSMKTKVSDLEKKISENASATVGMSDTINSASNELETKNQKLLSTIEQFKIKIRTLVAGEKRSTVAITEYGEKNAELEQKIKTLTQEVLELTTQLTSEAQKLSSSSTDLDACRLKATTEKATFDVREKKLNAEITELEKKYKGAEAELKNRVAAPRKPEADPEKKKLTAQLTNTTAEAEEVRTRLVAANAEIKRLELELDRLKAKTEQQLRDALSDAKKNHKVLLQQQRAEAEAESNRLRRELETMTAKREACVAARRADASERQSAPGRRVSPLQNETSQPVPSGPKRDTAARSAEHLLDNLRFPLPSLNPRISEPSH